MPTKTARRKKGAAEESAGGRYIFDKELGKVVKVSAKVPQVASRGRGASPAPGPCGRNACGGGRCAA